MASIGALVANLSVNTQAFTKPIQAAQNTLGTFQRVVKATVETGANLDSLRLNNDLPKQLTEASTQMTFLQKASMMAVSGLTMVEHLLNLTSSLAGVAALALRAVGSVVAPFSVSLGIASNRLTAMMINVIALRKTLATLANALRLVIDGIRVLLRPFEWLLAVVKHMAIAVMLILTPFKFLAGVMFSVAKSVLSLIGPLLTLAGKLFNVWVWWKALGIQLQFQRKILAALPLRVKLLAGALMGLGLASQTASVALNATGFAGRALGSAISLLTLPVRAVISPMKTLRSTVSGLAISLKALPSIAGVAGAALGKLSYAVSGLMVMASGLITRIGLWGSVFGAGAIAIVKMASDTETLALQFRVMTGSAETAAKLMNDIQKFAAQTPFESMEIASAAKQLVAFGGNAGTVIGELRMLGDIASGLSIPLGELAEIYGRARVQGRLFAQDIKEFQGRGIPVVQALSAQFGVTTTEIMAMVSAGQIGFNEIQTAFASMTAEGGAFHKMMEQQSQTTAGKFSTLMDNVKLLATAIGKILLPVANMLIDWALSFGKQMELIGKIVQVLAKNLKVTFAAMLETLRGYVKATFDYIVSAAAVLGENIAIAVQNAFPSLMQKMRQLGEDMAFYLGLSDEILPVPIEDKKKLLAMPTFQAPSLGPAGQELANLLAPAFENGANDFAAQIDSANVSQTEQQAKSEKTLTGAMLRGSQEAYSAIAQAMNGSKDPVVAATKEQTHLLLKPLSQIAAGFGNMGGAILVNNLMGPQ